MIYLTPGTLHGGTHGPEIEEHFRIVLILLIMTCNLTICFA